MFETTWTIDKKFYDRYWRLLYSGLIKRFVFFWVCYVIFCMIFVSFIPVVAIVSAVLMAIILSLFAFKSISRYKKINLKRVSEMTGKVSYLQTSRFEEDGVVIKDYLCNSTIKIVYNNFVKFKKTNDVWFLFTSTGLFVPIFVENFSEEEKRDLLIFLEERLVDVKGF